MYLRFEDIYPEGTEKIFNPAVLDMPIPNFAISRLSRKKMTPAEKKKW